MSLPEASESAGEPATVANPSFDLDTYIGRYAPGSETFLQRLAFIAQQTSDSQTRQSALNMLEHQLKESGNVVRYNQVMTSSPDTEWVRTTTANNEAALEVLEARLNAAQANLNKDAIRNCYLNLGDYFVKVGQLRDALRNVLRSRDYCTTRAQTGHICWKVVELSMNLANYSQVRDYVAKAEHAVVAGDVHFPNKLKVAAGMALLGEGQYKESAQKFAQVKIPPEDMTMLASPEDVALYSSVLALATMDRNELVVYLEDQPTILELVPVVRDAMRHYLRAEYKECLNALHIAGMELDLHLARHAEALVKLVRQRSYVDYLQPYRKVQLPHMAKMFGETAELVRTTLAKVISNGEIRHARIDCRTQTLEREDAQAVEQARLRKSQQRVQQLQESVLNDAYASIVRLACLENEPSPERGSANNNFANPEDILADVDSDDDVEMIHDIAANPEDVF